MVTNGASISIQTFPARDVLVRTTGVGPANICGTRVSVIANRFPIVISFIRGPITIIVQAIA
jgi:hypothetical protein